MSFLFASSPLLLVANSRKEIKSVHNNQVVATRLSFLDMSFRVKVTPVVQRKIHNYVTSGREKTNIILQSMAMYKPIFDKFIEEKNLPKELAYLPVVESAVDPHAKSHAGAVGLWQFMAPTARSKGLAINGLVDERIDPIKSTEKALDYLQELHHMFGDWTLALAAYNCGPGRIQTILRSNKHAKDVWDILPYLPKETQEYVPSLIAATYVANYYDKFNLRPNPLHTNEFYTTTLIVFDNLNLKEVSNTLGMKYSLIKKLNPSYKTGIIPKSSKGNYLVIPHEKINTYFDQHVGDIDVLISPDEILITDSYAEGFDFVVSDKSLEIPIVDDEDFNTSIPTNDGKNQKERPNFHFLNDRMNRYIRISREGSGESRGFASLDNHEEISIIIEENFGGSIALLKWRV